MEENDSRLPDENQIRSEEDKPRSAFEDLMFMDEPQTESPQTIQPVTQEVAAPPLKKVNYFKRDLGLSSITGGLTYSLAVLLYVGLSFFISFILGIANVNTDGNVFIYVSSLVSPLAICITLAIILCTRKVKFKEIFPVKTNAKYYLMAVLLTFGMLFIGSIVSTFFLNFLEIIGYTPDDSFLPDVSGVQILPAIIFMALIPAFFEELLFRGIILHSAEQSMGSVRAIFVTGFCFALMHGSPQQTVHQFLLGCMLSFLTVRSRSVLPAMLVHFLNNLIAVVMLAFSDSLGLAVTMEEFTPADMLLGLFVYAAIGAAIGMFVWLINDRRKPLLAGKKYGVSNFFIGASVGIVIMSVMWILDLFLSIAA